MSLEQPSRESETDAETDIPSKRNVARLFGRRRQNLDRDGFVEDYGWIDEDTGRKMKEVVIDEDQGKSYELDSTALFGAAPSRSSNIDHIRIEAELIAEGKDLKNPHIPSNDDVLETALERLAEEGLTPAWEAIDGNANAEQEVTRE